MELLEKSFIGLEKSLSGEHQEFIDYFSAFLKKSSNFNGKTTDAKPQSDITKKISSNVVRPSGEKTGYGTKEIKDDLKKLIGIAQKDELLRVDYAEITQAVLNVDQDKENISDNLADFLVAIKNEYYSILTEFKNKVLKQDKDKLTSPQKSEENAIICVGKAIEHARLAHVQYNYLYLESQNRINSLHKNVKEAETNILESKKKLNNEINKLSEKQKSVYTDFIAILGVFASFVFVMFGGFSALSSIIESIGRANISMAKVIFISSVLIGFLITVLYSLIYWVSLIIDKKIVYKSCDCEGVCYKAKHIYGKHRYYITIVGICFIVAFVIAVCIMTGIVK
jgi:hypothetical protein